MPEDDPDGDGDVERVFGAELRDLQSEVGRVHHRLVNAVHLVAEDQRILLPAGEFRGESLKAD